VILTPSRWSTLKLAEFPLSMLLWIWPIGTVVLGHGRVMSKGGEIGISGSLRRTRDLGNSIRSVNASLYPCLRCLGMSLFWYLLLIFGLMHSMLFSSAMGRWLQPWLMSWCWLV
jgi:hypothetical protein